MKRYCIVGVGGRGTNMFLRPLISEYEDVAQVVGLCDINAIRLEKVQEELGLDIPCFTNYDDMLRSVVCDVVIVATKDSTHHEFIIKALAADKDVITEKPMTIDDVKCRAILAAEAKSAGRVRVTFNYRFHAYATRMTQLLREGTIGEVHSVDFAWFLDTVHGANYFRRWHRRKENSGGLLVHKATHHFDLLNWALDQEPTRVYASGGLRFYGPARAERGQRCVMCHYGESCQFFKPGASAGQDGGVAEDYYGDHCVFGSDIDIEDTMGVMVNYSGGTQLHYSLNAFLPFEGFRAAFNGSKGRLEVGLISDFIPQVTHSFKERSKMRRPIDPWRAAAGDLSLTREGEIRTYPLFGGVRTERVPLTGEGHGGGDQALRDMLFRENIPDPLGHVAGSRAGAMSILIGVAANQSIATGMPVSIADLLSEPEGIVWKPDLGML